MAKEMKGTFTFVQKDRRTKVNVPFISLIT